MTSDIAETAPRRQKVQAAEVGTDILKGLAELAPATSLSRLAEHVGMPASKVHRYLQALIASGFAEQDPATNHYGLGQAALFVGLAALGRLDVVKVATPCLAELRDELNETCFLAVWGNRGPTVVHVEQAVRAITLVTQVGSVLPLLGSSTGLVFNAFLPDLETAPLREEELKAAGAPSPTTLQETVEAIRTTHLQSVHGLLMAGVNALSAPLFAAGGRLVGVITVVGAEPGFKAEPDGVAARRLLEGARLISARMGGEVL
ncbi:IclR family transcriptional regulator [Pseudomonas indica]|uniref:IclR family transcriptional regulator n=1 Tax=Pseudomonas indica TaxID=137658 RepID=UPI000BAB3554|nr:IclR family transcriptional regulator [Pseudomonas indica]MBU3059265.1 IclR family transcriptional regulator [Pseudomonas indica]PAU64864.1 IclR family transcriptional regulator [Pseudomonas indica]